MTYVGKVYRIDSAGRITIPRSLLNIIDPNMTFPFYRWNITEGKVLLERIYEDPFSDGSKAEATLIRKKMDEYEERQKILIMKRKNDRLIFH